MKKYALIWAVVLVLAAWGIAAAETPHQLGPFILNHDIAQFSKFVHMDTALSIRHMESIQEVEIKPIMGFKSGLIAYGTCAVSNRIVRIKLKYSDDSKTFYEKLKKRIDTRFGKSNEYRGDPFHIVIGWKWSFVDQDKQNISLILQHNTRYEDEKMGNSIKLSMTSLIQSERECHYKGMGKSLTDAGNSEPLVLEQSGWNLFVPR